jgi:hypothetical protein
MSQAAEEFATVELGDQRLGKRLVKPAQQLGEAPGATRRRRVVRQAILAAAFEARPQRSKGQRPQPPELL